MSEDLPQRVTRTCVLCKKTVPLRFNKSAFEIEANYLKPQPASETYGYSVLPGGRFYHWRPGAQGFHCWDCAKKCQKAIGWKERELEYTWQDYDAGISHLSNIIPPYGIVVGIARAGAMVAAHLSMNLMVGLFTLDFNIPRSIDFFNECADTGIPILMVDDFINKGDTIRKVYKVCPGKTFDWAVLILNTMCEETKNIPNVYYHKTINETVDGMFVKFPWGPG